MATIFTKIANGEIPSYKVAESNDYYAFLDINPLAKGHVLVIPKKIEAIAVKAAIPCKRVGVAVLGMEVPHTHIHLVPLNAESDMDFRKEKLHLSEDEFAHIANSIAEEFKKL